MRHTLRIGCIPNIFTLFSSVSIFYIRKSFYEANPLFTMLFSVFQVPTVCHSGVILVVNSDQIMWERRSLCVDGFSTSGFTHQTLFRTEFSHRRLKQNRTHHHILTHNCWEKSMESIYLFLFKKLSFWHIMERIFDCPPPPVLIKRTTFEKSWLDFVIYVLLLLDLYDLLVGCFSSKTQRVI